MDYARELEVARSTPPQPRAAITLEYFGRGVAVERKADASPVTIADRRAEESLRATIGEAFPDDGILGEELGETPGTSGRRWIIDPIDGTQSFIRGVPLYGVLVGARGTRATACVGVDRACLLSARRYWAARGGGAFLNGERVRVSAVTRLADATVLTSDAKPAATSATSTPASSTCSRAVARHRGWGDCYGYALVATGRADVMLDPLVNPWDVAA